MKRVCVIIPAYNEEAVIESVIKKAKKVFSKVEKDYLIDIVLVNDGSKDDTLEQAKKGGAIVIDHILNSGAGHDPEDVLAGIKKISTSNTDLLIGSRLINSEGMSRTKVLGNKGLSFITYVLFGINVTDSQSGLRVYSRKAIDSLDWKSTGYEFCSEMIWRAKQASMVISEYPIKAIYTDYSRAKGQNNWNAINIIKRLFKQRLTELFE